MKINLMYGSGQKLQGFLNINPIPNEDEDVITSDVTNLDFFVDDAEAEVIIARDVINFLPRRYMTAATNHWVKKLRHGGRIVMGGLDIYSLSRDVISKKISLHDLNIILYGSESPSWDVRTNIFNMESLVSYLKTDCGLTIMKSRIDKYEIVVEAIRP